MVTTPDLISAAFDRLANMSGFSKRPDQQQLALLLSDCIEAQSTCAYEAPTGLGKSLAALVPAIAHALLHGKRTVIATYTNVLAEQYWRNDLPLALKLFRTGDEVSPPIRTEFLIGRQRYACLAAMHEHAPGTLREFQLAKLGVESEFRKFVHKQPRELTQIWQQIAAPPVCPARLCSHYSDCHYYRARRQAERAHIVITNHSVVLQDAILKQASEDELSLLGDYDFLIVDEAHDFAQAAQNSLEFELSENKLAVISGIVGRIESTLMPLAIEASEGHEWAEACEGFRRALSSSQHSMKAYGLALGGPGILAAAPEEVWQHPQVKQRATAQGLYSAQELASDVAERTQSFLASVERTLDKWRKNEQVPAERIDQARETMNNYAMYLREFGLGCEALFTPRGVAVSYAGGMEGATILRQDIVGLAKPLKEMLWDKASWACLSATLALDGNFDFFKRSTGAEPQFEEMLPSPFDFASQAAVYMPKGGLIPDPTVARKQGIEQNYYDAIARELSQIIRAMGGRTLALFHSRKEMEAVRMLMDVPADLPIYVQGRSAASSTGEKFLRETRSSMFALRSFWTGFDAPGETLSCVALVRVPFEVPIDPPQIARLAWLQTQGMDAFACHTLPMAKMLMRQGAGRLIRRAGDRGIVAILDSRLRSKRYGEEILANLPSGMRVFDDIYDAVAHVGLEGELALNTGR